MTEQEYKQSLNLIQNSVFTNIPLQWVESFQPGIGQIIANIEREVVEWADPNKPIWDSDPAQSGTYNAVKNELSAFAQNLQKYKDDPARSEVIYDFINAARSLYSFNKNYGLDATPLTNAVNPFKLSVVSSRVTSFGYMHFKNLSNLVKFNEDLLASIDDEKIQLKGYTKTVLEPVREKLYKLITEDPEFKNLLDELGFGEVDDFIQSFAPNAGALESLTDEFFSNFNTFVGNISARLDTERETTDLAIADARAAAQESIDEALGRVDNLVADLSTYQTGVNTQIQSIQSAYESLNSTVQLNVSRIGATEAAIIQEATTRADGFVATASQINAIVSRIDDVDSSIIQEANTRASEDAATVDRIDQLVTRVNDNAAAIVNEQNARTTDLLAEAEARETLAAQLKSEGELYASGLVTSEANTRASQDEILGERIDLVSAEVGGISTAILNEQTARITGDAAEATSRKALSTKLFGTDVIDGITVDTLTSGFLYDQQQSVITQTESAVTNVISQIAQIQTDLTNTKADLLTETTTRVNEYGAIATSVTALSTEFNNQKATLDSLNSIVSGPDGITTQWGIKSDINGYITGVGLISSSKYGTPTSQFIVYADQFALVTPGVNGGQPTLPFFVGSEQGYLELSNTVKSNWNNITGSNKPADNATRNVFRGDWAISTSYVVGDIVLKDGNGWSCILAHASTSGNQPPASGSGNTWWTLYAVKGSDGAQGLHALTTLVPNNAHTLPAASDGVVASYTGSGTAIQIFEGTTALSAVSSITANGQFTIGTPTQLPASTITVGVRSYSGTTATVAQHSAMAAGTDSVVITYPITARRANGANVTINCSQTITKSKAGAQGTQGIQGPKGDDGITYYTWVKYADSPTTGMSDFPDGKLYLGVAYNKTTAVESTTYADYSWSLIKGSDGVQGPKGDDGVTTYTWIKYADTSAGAGMSDSPTGKTYIGIAPNKTSPTESTTAGDYTWSLIQGPKGDQGPAVVVNSSRALSFTATDGTLDASQLDIVLTASVSGVASPTYAWAFSGLQTNPTASVTDSQTITAAQFGTSKSAIVTCTVNGTYVDKVTIVRLEKSTAAPYATTGSNLAAPFDSWNLLGQSLATITDGKVGSTSLRLTSAAGAYPIQRNFIPIDPTKKYRAKFWARPSADCNGSLYFNLRQAITTAPSWGPTNGGRHPYQPSAITRAAHNSTFGGTDQWGEYSYIWDSTQWQTGVKFFVPEFLNNYQGSTGYWEIQDVVVEEVTAVEAAKTLAIAAAAAAAEAQLDADAANAMLTDIASDSKLTPVEKKQVKLEWDSLVAEKSGIDAQADSYSITTEKAAYGTAYTTLSAYLTPLLSSLTTTSDIDGATFRGTFTTFYSARQALLNKISAVAGTRADYLLVSNKPEADGFLETFESDNLSQWTNYAGSGELSVVSVSDSLTGGKILRIGDNSGNDNKWLIHNQNIPFDPSALYRIKFRVRQIAGTGTLYLGLAGVAADGVTWVSVSGANSHSNQHYVAAVAQSPGAAWVEYVGYVKGTAAAGQAATNPPVTTPLKLHQNVKYIRPLIIANYPNAAGTLEVDYCSIERLTDAINWDAVSGTNKPENGATVGAPAGTLVAGVPAANVATAVTDFNASNNRNNAAITAPTILTDGTAVDHVAQTDGSVDISFEWSWSGNEGDIDGFLVYARPSTSSSAYTLGTTPAEETVYTVPANKRAFVLFGVAADKYYTFGVQAYRAVDKAINAAGVIKSTLVKATGSGENPYRPSSTVAFTGDVTGTISGTSASTLVSTASTALSNANAAQADATEALNDLTDIASDSKLTPAEKKSVRKEWDAIYAERASIRSQADVFSITTEKTNYDNAFQTLGTYLNAGTAYTIGATPPSWITDANLSTTTTIVGSTFRANWSNLYADRQALLNKISAEAAKRADWSNVSGANKPEDGATKNRIFTQATAPVGASNGDIWIDTSVTPSVQKMMVGGSWQLAATVGADFGRFNVTSTVLNEQFASGFTGWVNRSGDGEVAAYNNPANPYGSTDGKYVYFGNSSGNDQVWAVRTAQLFPYDPNKLYRMRVRCRQTGGSGELYIGFEGIAADGTTYVTWDGQNLFGSQHYFVATEKKLPVVDYTDPNTWTELVGYAKGSAAQSDLGEFPSYSNPCRLHANVKYFRPVVIANYNYQPGSFDLDYVIIEEGTVDPGNLTGKITQSNVTTWIDNAAIGAAQIGSVELVGESAFKVRTNNTTNARMDMDSRRIKIFDSNGTLRVQLGDLTV